MNSFLTSEPPPLPCRCCYVAKQDTVTNDEVVCWRRPDEEQPAPFRLKMLLLLTHHWPIGWKEPQWGVGMMPQKEWVGESKNELQNEMPENRKCSLIPERALVLCKLLYTLVFDSFTFYLLFSFLKNWKSVSLLPFRKRLSENSFTFRRNFDCAVCSNHTLASVSKLLISSCFFCLWFCF